MPEAQSTSLDHYQVGYDLMGMRAEDINDTNLKICSISGLLLFPHVRAQLPLMLIRSTHAHWDKR